MAKKKKKATAKDDLPIEDAMEELDAIVEALESGQTSLSESLERFERGMVLLRSCHQQLDSAARRIEMLTGISEDGEVSTVPFDGAATASQTADDSDEESDAGALF